MTTFLVPEPATTATSVAKLLTVNTRDADPFTPANVTWNEMIASTAEDWGGFYIYIFGSDNERGVAVVATGAASSEVIIASLPTQVDGAGDFGTFVPIAVPAGTRISVACEEDSAASSVYAQVIGIPSSVFSSDPAFTNMDMGPIDLTNTTSYGRWPIIDPGGTINTKGSWTEVSQLGTNGANNILNGDSLDYAYSHLGLLLNNNHNASIGTNYLRLWDIAYGASGSEVIFAANIAQKATTRERAVHGTSIIWFPWDRATTERIAVRMQSDTVADATDRLGAVLLFGLR